MRPRSAASKKASRQLLNIACDKTGDISIDEDIGPGWRFARTEWHFSKSHVLERHAHTCRIRASLFSTTYNFTAVNELSTDFLPTDTKFPGDSDSPQFAPHTGNHYGVSVSVDGSRCRLSLKLFDDDGRFNRELAWQRRSGKPTFRFWYDLWAKTLEFTKPPVYEEIAATWTPKPSSRSAVQVFDEELYDLGIPPTDPEAEKREIENRNRVHLRPMRLELYIVVHPPPPKPAPHYVEWWERTFPGWQIVSGGRPESNRRKF